MSSVGGIAFTLALLGALIMPQPTHAATFAYVDVVGIVRSMVATDWQTAIATAPSRAARSGVMLLQSASDALVGDDVDGI
jgi:hypothetical protein